MDKKQPRTWDEANEMAYECLCMNTAEPKPVTITFGRKTFLLTGRTWNRETFSADITFEDDNGIEYSGQAWGMTDYECRDAMKEILLREHKGLTS